MKILKYVVIIIISVVLSILISKIDDINIPDFSFSDDNPSELPDDSGDPDDPSDFEEKGQEEFTLYYDQLSDFQKKIYDAMEKAVAKADEKFTLSDINTYDFQSEIEEVTKALQYDHPEYFWYQGGCSSSIPMREIADVTVKPIYYGYVSTFFDEEDKLDELKVAVKNVTSLARQHSNDDYERIIFVHDYLVKNAIYDHDSLDEYYETSRSPSCEYIFSAYGCLVNGRTVCSGYAKAFQLIMREMGYDATYVVGYAGGAHGWNCIYLDGEGYFVDITWDDADFSKEIPFYDYALITSEMLSRTHLIDMPFTMPECTKTDYNYLIKKGYYLDKFDMDSALEILSKQANNDAAYIMFGSEREYYKAETELYNSNKLKKIIDFKHLYGKEEFHILTFILKE